MARSVRVSGDRLAEFLRQPPDPGIAFVDVTSPPARWAPLKPLLAGLARSYRERGGAPPVFGGVPLCLFGSEWQGFPSRPRTTPERGRCAACAARRSCGVADAVPDELLPISETTALERWRAYGAAFARVTGSDAAVACTPVLERILAAYRGPVSLEPSVLLSTAVEPVARCVVFPHRLAGDAAGKAESAAVLACVRTLLRELGAAPCDALLGALGALRPLPMPLGIEAHARAWRLKVYLRLEDETPAGRRGALEALSRGGASMDPVSPTDLQMLGLVLDEGGLHTVKAYVAARATVRGPDGFPPPLQADHPLVRLAGDRALGTLDVWCRGTRRANKWDFNLREHYLAGQCAERLAEALTSPRSAAQLAPLLGGSTYRADIVAVGVRATTVALYVELN
jgi:hypothetical protein